jgi:dihydroxyacid dehydratase/phosphogluconate dehydratase
VTDISRKDKWQSGTITDGPTRAGARSMLFAAGFDRDALARPIIGVANTWTEIGPCNLHLRDLATDPRKADVARRAGALVMDVLRAGRRPSSIVTRAALENAIASVAATGGSTNAVLHLVAIAREAGVPLDLDDFDRANARVPVLADLKLDS